MKRQPFVCGTCKTIVDWVGNQYEERIEIRNKKHTESLGSSPVIAYYCKGCAVKRKNELKGLDPSLQGSLL